MRRSVSVLIPAYKADEFIMDCLDSIEGQTYFRDAEYEILVGVDGCNDTTNVLVDVYDLYPNLRVLLMDTHEGQGVTLNTLLRAAQFDTILKFDADDVACEDLLKKTIPLLDKFDLVKFGYDNFETTVEKPVNKSHFSSDCVYLLTKEVALEVNGWEDWYCLGGQEILRRIDKSRQGEVNEVLFHRRMHENAFRNDEEYGIGSSYRSVLQKRLWRETKYKNRIMSMGNSFKELNNVRDREKRPLSIVIAAYMAQEFIEDCLDSIYGQTYFINNDKFEVIIGVDACYQTLAKLDSIKGKYSNLRVIMNKVNSGVYVTINTLMSLCTYDTILRFDADDIMKPTLVSKGMFFTENNDVVMFGYDTFRVLIEDVWPSNFRHAHGVIFLKKSLFNKAGGFLSWSCAADSEFLSRTRLHSTRYKMKSRLFYRRIHEDSLTRKGGTAYYSDKRKEYKSHIRVYDKDEDIWVERICSEYTEM